MLRAHRIFNEKYADRASPVWYDPLNRRLPGQGFHNLVSHETCHECDHPTVQWLQRDQNGLLLRREYIARR